jgi:hypothetical protein
VGAWANESQYYDFDAPTGFSEQTGHFTQLVWKGTTEVGCGVTNCPPVSSSSSSSDDSGSNPAQGWFVVCEYRPPGNVVGDDNIWFTQNVDPPVNLGIRRVAVGGVRLGWVVVLVVIFSQWVF